MIEKFKTSLCSAFSLTILFVCASCLFAQPNSDAKASLRQKNSRAIPESERITAASNELNQKGLKQVQVRDFTTAEVTFSRALAEDPRNITAAFNLASAYIINKKEDAAIVLLNEYVQKVPKDTGLLLRLGDAYFSKKDLLNAGQVYKRVYDIDADYPEILIKLASVSLLINKPLEAEKYLEDQLAKNPKDGKSVANLSSVYLTNGKTDQAIATSKKALQFKAEKEVYITLATAYEMQKDYANALIAFQRAVDLGDDRIEVMKKIEGLKKATS